MCRRVQWILFIVLSSLFLWVNLLNAQMMETLITLKASVEAGSKVELNWENRSVETVRMYFVFRASAYDTTRFSLVDSTSDKSYSDYPVVTTSSSVFVYYVAGVTTRGVVIKSNLVFVSMTQVSSDRDIVRIISDPKEYAQVGVEYHYQVIAVSSNTSAKFTYALTVAPAGMTIDSTGLVTWVPQEKGFAYIEIKVVSDKGGQAVQRYTIRVAGENGMVAGTVTDSEGKPIRGALVQLYRSDRSLWFNYKSFTDSTGRYKIGSVEPGEYYARAEHPYYQPQWYNGASSLSEATKITVEGNTVTTVDFKLKLRQSLTVTFIVEGSVVDTVRHAPIRGAFVVFVDAAFALNSSLLTNTDISTRVDLKGMFDGDDEFDHRLEGYSRFVFKTRTDSLGHYSLRVPQGSYIAFAYAKGYVKIFYNDKTNLLSADIIRVNSNMQINFALPILPLAMYGEISGAVIDSATGLGVRARVIAFRDRWGKNDLWKTSRHYVTDTDSAGKYTLSELLPGDYIIMAVPMGSYTPSFYNSSGAITLRWQLATKLTIKGNILAGIDVYVKAMLRSVEGYTYISGTVTASAQVSGGSAGISGAVVVATDVNGSVVGYGFSGEGGTYAIAGLAPGTYRLFADDPGYISSNSATASPTYTSTGSPQPASSSFTMNPVSTTDVGENPIVPSDYVVEQNYPNPFNPSTQIVFSIPQAERVTVTIFNILGQRIVTLIDKALTAGYHNVVWDGRDDAGRGVSTGVYLYRISTPSFVATKKMTLLK